MCPGPFCSQEGCSASGNLTCLDIGLAPSYLCIVSSVFSCLGSLLVLLSYCRLPDAENARTGAMKIISMLAVADLFGALGYMMGSINFLSHYDTHTNSSSCGAVFERVCEVQSFIITWSSLCSYVWTCILALYFFLLARMSEQTKQQRFANRMLLLYNLLAWLTPLVIVVPLLLGRQLGYSHYAESDWCFIKSSVRNHSGHHGGLQSDPLHVFLILLASKFWEILSYIVVVVLYAATAWKLRNVRLQKKARIERRLLAIPLLYLLLRIWGTLQFFYSLGASRYQVGLCVPVNVQKAYAFFGIMQAIGDSGQGWGNALLYIILVFPAIKNQLLPADNCTCCCSLRDLTFGRITNKFMLLLNSSAYEDPHERSALTRSTYSSSYKCVRVHQSTKKTNFYQAYK